VCGTIYFKKQQPNWAAFLMAYIDRFLTLRNYVTVNRLAERATINRITFYLHYRDIPDMLEKMADDMIEEFSTVIKNTPAVGQTSE